MIINLSNEKSIEFDFVSTLDHSSREELVNTIASLFDDKKVIVTYYLPYDYEGLKALVMEENK